MDKRKLIVVKNEEATLSSNLLENDIEREENKEEQKEEQESNAEYPYRPRQITVYYQKYNNNLYKILIPYDFELKRYFAKKEEISFYDHKDYLIEKLDEFCKNEVFNIEKKIIPKGCWQRFVIHLPKFLFFLVYLYVFIFISLLTFFNPAILTILYFIMQKIYKSLKIIRFVKYEKLKMKEIENLLEIENQTQFCKDNGIKWILGQSGYWLEVKKNE